MHVSAITDKDWDSFCEAHPDKGLLHRTGWRAVHGDALQRFAVLGNGDQPVAVFQLMRSRRSGLTLWSHPAFNQNCAFLMAERANNPAKRIGEAKRVHAAVADHLLALGGVVTVAFPSVVNDMQPYIWKGFKTVPSYTYRLALGAGIATARAGYSAETRNSMRKAEADGVSTRSATRAEVLPMVEATFTRKEKALDRSKADAILAAFLDGGHGFAKVAELGGKPVAAAFCACDTSTAYYLLGGHVKQGGHAGAGAMLLDACIAEASTRGLATFDFEGSMLPDVERFFRSFGGALVPYFTVNHAPFAVEVVLKRSWRHAF